MTVNLSALAGAGQQFFDNNGNPLSGGKLYSYVAGTTTPQATYTSVSGATAHTNPIVLDSAGRVATGEIWVTAGQNYKFVLKTSTEVTIATWDNITGINGTGIATAAVNVSFTGFNGQVGTVQDLADDDGSDWIGFDPSAASGVARSAQDKMRDTVSVKDFGAVGDGVTDDTAAIQAAANALTQNSSLVFPPGSYAVSDSITFSQSNITVVGYGAKITQSGAYKKTFNFNAISSIEVASIWFVGKGTEHIGASTSYNGVAAVYFSSCTNVNVHDCQMTNHAGGSIRWGGSASSFRFTDNKIVGIGTAGGIVAGDNNSDFAIAGYGSSGDSNVVISGNDISSHCFGIGLTTSSNCSISGNAIYDIPGQHGMYLSSPGTTTIVGNALLNIAYEGIKCQIGSAGVQTQNLIVSGNTIRTAGQSGVVIGTTSVVAGSSITTVVVSGNVISDVGNYGVFCRQVNDALVQGNNLYDIGAYGIYWDDVNGEVSNNFIKYCEWSALWLELESDSHVYGNVIIDAVLNVAGEASQARNIYYVYVAKGSSAASDPELFFARNTLQLVGSAPTNFSASGKCVRTGTGVLVYWDSNFNLTTKAWQFNTAGELKSINIGYSPNVAFTSAANSNPSTPIYGRGRRELYGSQNPSSAGMTDTFIQGDVCWNSQPTAGGVPGWVCTTGGSPGTWKAMANLAV